MKTYRTIAGLATCVVIGAGLFFIYQIKSTPPACPLPDYSVYHGAPQDLLIFEGRCVVPTAIEAIQDRSLARRPNIIDFLGNGAYKEALEPLVHIVEDVSDPDRDFAVIAVFQIDNEKGRELAKKYATEESDLGKCSRDILANKDYLHDRTSYLEAWRHYISITYAL